MARVSKLDPLVDVQGFAPHNPDRTAGAPDDTVLLLLGLVTHIQISGWLAPLRCKQWMADAHYCARVTYFTKEDVHKIQLKGMTPQGVTLNP